MRRFAVLGGSLTFLACQITTGTAGELVLAVSADQTTIRAGQLVSVKVTATNEGDATVTLVPPGCAHAIEVRREHGVRVEHAEGIFCLLAAAPIALAPGRGIVVNGSWRARTGPLATPVLPGSYRLRAINFTVFGGAIVRHVEASVRVTE